MNEKDDDRSARPGAGEAQPWHAADEKRQADKPQAKPNAAPLGTPDLPGRHAQISRYLVRIAPSG